MGLLFYILLSLANPADETFGSLRDVFVTKGKTLLTAVLSVPVLIVMLQRYDQVNEISSFACGYLNASLLRKVAETWSGRDKILKGDK